MGNYSWKYMCKFSHKRQIICCITCCIFAFAEKYNRFRGNTTTQSSQTIGYCGCYSGNGYTIYRAAPHLKKEMNYEVHLFFNIVYAAPGRLRQFMVCCEKDSFTFARSRWIFAIAGRNTYGVQPVTTVSVWL